MVKASRTEGFMKLPIILLSLTIAIGPSTRGWAQSADNPPPSDNQPVVYYTHASRGWSGIPTVVISGTSDDPRIDLVVQAVSFWNTKLEQIGSPFRLGSITKTSQIIADDFLQGRSLGVLGGTVTAGAPQWITDTHGSIIVALSNAEFVSFTSLVGSNVVIGIRNGKSVPLALPNVALNVITHEMGHAIGLGHNNDPTTLMCGRPADCRPDAFESDDERVFPVTDVEAGFLLDLYPPTWTATNQ
jgi:hypothetical protein